jgi:murein DD-endopeptidase MepM/ murein hydrolase activator NlpD
MQRAGSLSPDYEQASGPRLDIVALAALIFALFLVGNLFFARGESKNTAQDSSKPRPPPVTDPAAFAAPYDKYTITQGTHGASYGHMAIDIAAGKGATIKSPINGEITRLFTDRYGNPTLVIENKFYKITLLHGIYDVVVGERVQIGQTIGKESNRGYTTDMQGRPCRQRNCGYHTHLNVFDKRVSKNINPLNLLDESSK